MLYDESKDALDALFLLNLIHFISANSLLLMCDKIAWKLNIQVGNQR